MVIAIDGPAGAGKSTVARAVAERLGATYLDSGAMYRAVALAAQRRGVAATEAGQLAAIVSIELPGEGVVLLDGEEVTSLVRTPEISEAASVVAADPVVRAAMVDQQRALLHTGNWVAEGRDIGTVVWPRAELKVFLTASAEARARRRASERGADVGEVRAELAARDARDTERAASPLRAADDAVALDTTGLSVEQVVDRIAALAGV